MLGSLYKILFFWVRGGLLDKTILICTFLQYLYFFLRLAVMVLAFFQDQRAEGEFSSCCLRNTIWLSNPVLWGPLLWVTSRVYTNTSKNPWMNNWENLKNANLQITELLFEVFVFVKYHECFRICIKIFVLLVTIRDMNYN